MKTVRRWGKGINSPSRHVFVRDLEARGLEQLTGRMTVRKNGKIIWLDKDILNICARRGDWTLDIEGSVYLWRCSFGEYILELTDLAEQ